MKTETTKNKYTDVAYIAICEAVAAILIIAVYAIIGRFSLKVAAGALLGAAVATVNFLILTVSVDRTIKKFLDIRGDKEMDEEEARAFAKSNSLKVQNAMTKSYILRTVIMIGTLVVAFITKLFDPLATLIPLLLYKPLIYLIEVIKKKRGE